MKKLQLLKLLDFLITGRALQLIYNMHRVCITIFTVYQMPNDPRRLVACPSNAGCSIINSANPSRYKIAGTNGICMVGSSGVIRLWIMVSFSSALALLFV